MNAAGQLPLALTAPDPRRIVRRSDSGASAAAAVEVVESGAEAAQVLYVIGLVTSLPGRTSAELAQETAEVGARLGFGPAAWRYTLARRLSTAEDGGAGPIVGHEWRFVPQRPWREVEPDLAPCRCSGKRAIRWWPVGGRA